MSRIKEPFDFYSIADVVEKNYEFCHSATSVFVCLFSFFLSFFFFFFFTFLDSRDRLDRKGETALTLEDCLCRRFDGSSSVCVSDNFFPFSIFLVLFRGWHDILKEIEESSSRHGITVTSSRRGSVTGFFLNRSILGFFFPSMLVVIISWSLCRHRQQILIEYLLNSVSF